MYMSKELQAWEKQSEAWVKGQKNSIKESEFLIGTLDQHIKILQEQKRLEIQQLKLKKKTLSESLKLFKKATV